MKKLLLSSVLVVASLSPFVAQAQVGSITTFANGSVYAVVPYGNNPDIFCKTGMPSDGWKAIDPNTGTWTAIRHYPNLQWVPTYQYICPRGSLVNAAK